MELPKRVLTEQEASTYIGMSRSWLRISRCHGKYEAPPFVKLGRSVRYLLEDLDQWLQKNRFINTAGGRPDDPEVQQYFAQTRKRSFRHPAYP